MNLRSLTGEDVLIYRSLRLRALGEWPPAFGTSVEEETAVGLEDLAERLTPSRQQRLFGAYEDDVLAGSIRLTRCEDGQCSAYIAGFYVASEHRRKGYGRALLSNAIGYARSEWESLRLDLAVVSQQNAAIALYRSVGFTEYGIERETFERRGEFFDEIQMTLDLRIRD
jgi:ribosomal protein S18 acetylase RimI-like enzyme